MWNNETKARVKSQKSRIIELLRSAGENGVFNTSLSNIALHYGKRISELYSVGYVITHEDLGNGLVKYILVSEPETPMQPQKAIDVLMNKINDLNCVNSENLQQLLKELNITIRFKNGEYKKAR